ncbi:anthranilate phosphoribosyltransferase [Haloglycomyces albus]|uniref:anthranilate phosphoribosyltransferase n=1 Tax=Haloglycomyces albus TaxID=526067 RepID=UPI0004A503DD
MDQNWQAVLSHLIAGEDLDSAAAAWAMGQIMSGRTEPEQLASFAVLLRAKGESLTELDAIADRMRQEAVPLQIPLTDTAIDIVGTGGDGSGSVNISTMAAVVAAAAGTPVIKHGNRAASSQCGSADLLEALGVNLEANPEFVAKSLTEVGIGFCFARSFHPGMRHAAPVRQTIRVPTVFNLLGPLTNPASPDAGLIGCADLSKAPLLAGVFARRGHTVMVARGQDGLDEISTTAPSDVWCTNRRGDVVRRVVDPRDFGLPRAQSSDLTGGNIEVNTAVARSVFRGETGPVRDAVLINSAAALATASAHSHEDGLTDDAYRHSAIAAGLDRARAAIDGGAARALVERWSDL